MTAVCLHPAVRGLALHLACPCTALCCSSAVQCRAVQHCKALHCAALHCTTIHFTLCTLLHCTALQTVYCSDLQFLAVPAWGLSSQKAVGAALGKHRGALQSGGGEASTTLDTKLVIFFFFIFSSSKKSETLKFFLFSVQRIVLYSRIIRKQFVNRFVTNLFANI